MLILAGCSSLGASVQEALIPLPVDIVKTDVAQRLRVLPIDFSGFEVVIVENRLPGLHGKSASVSLSQRGGSGLLIHLPFEYNYRFDESNIPYIVYHPSDDELSRGMALAMGSYELVYGVAIEEFRKANLMDGEGFAVSMTMLSLDPARPKTPRWLVTLLNGGTEIAGTLVNGYTGEADEVTVY